MTGLAETIATLQRLKDAAMTPAPTSTGRFEETPGFGDNPGQLKMFSYMPEGLTPDAPLVVVLHGCGQHAEAHAVSAGWVTLADRCGFAVLAPEQSSQNNLNHCFNWFLQEDTVRGGGEVASIAAMTTHMIAEHRLDPKRVFITGLSAGGGMTAAMLACYPELFAGGAVIAGLPYGVAHNVSGALSAMHRADDRSSADLGRLVRDAAPRAGRMPRLAIWHGDADWTVDASNGLKLAQQWASAQGLPDGPNETIEGDGFTRSIWRSSDAKEAAVEFNLVHGLGHGTPLATTGPDGVGTPAPYMLEAGVSSTLEAARFWGLVSPQAATEGHASPPKARSVHAKSVRPSGALTKPPLSAILPRGAALPAKDALGKQVLGSIEKVVTPETARVIAKALKTAGLLK